MADVLITHSYFIRFDPKQLKAGMAYPPLATLSAAAVLRDHGFNLAFFDTMFSSTPQDAFPLLESLKPKLFIICDDGFNYLTKMCLTNMRDAALIMIRRARQLGCKIAISGSDATDHSDLYLDAGADFIVVGEAEYTIRELTDFVVRGTGDISQIAGIRYKKNSETIKNPPRENLRNLDELPFPAWDLVNFEPYRSVWLEHKGYVSVNMVTTRGCPFKCNWCAKPIYGNRYNSRSPRKVADELVLLKHRFGISHVWFADDIFGLKPGWLREFAAILKEENILIRFKIQSRADLLLEEEYIQYLAMAGCDEVWMGAESGSQKILDAMDKGTSISQIEEATRLLKQSGIKPCFFLQFGYPGEQEEDIELTIEMVKRLMPHDIGISVSYPLPGTRFYETVKQQLSNKQNWTDSDELLVMFRGTFSPEFYRQLQRLVHYRFRKWKAMEQWKRDRNIKKAVSLIYRIPRIYLAQHRLNRYARQYVESK